MAVAVVTRRELQYGCKSGLQDICIIPRCQSFDALGPSMNSVVGVVASVQTPPKPKRWGM